MRCLLNLDPSGRRARGGTHERPSEAVRQRRASPPPTHLHHQVRLALLHGRQLGGRVRFAALHVACVPVDVPSFLPPAGGAREIGVIRGWGRGRVRRAAPCQNVARAHPVTRAIAAPAALAQSWRAASTAAHCRVPPACSQQDAKPTAGRMQQARAPARQRLLAVAQVVVPVPTALHIIPAELIAPACACMTTRRAEAGQAVEDAARLGAAAGSGGGRQRRQAAALAGRQQRLLAAAGGVNRAQQLQQAGSK